MNPNVVARVAVAVIGAATLVLGASGAVSAARSAVAPEPNEITRVQHARFECIRERLEDALEPGAVVYVPLAPGPLDADLWKQRLIEMAFPLATVVDAPGPGVTTLSVRPDDTGTGCTGVLLVVETGS